MPTVLQYSRVLALRNALPAAISLLLSVWPSITWAVGNGNPPYQRPGEADQLAPVILFGGLLIGFLCMLALKKISPNLFSKLTLGLYSENTEDITLAKQVAEIKHDLTYMKGIIAHRTASLDDATTESDAEASNPGQGEERGAWVDLEGIIDKILAKKLPEVGEDSSASELLTLRAAVAAQEAQREEREAFNRMIDELMDNALRLRTRVFTIFAGINLWLIFLAIAATSFLRLEFSGVASGTREVVTSNVVQGVAGLYISMAIFLVYVFRNASSRISVLLALKEDQVHHHEVHKYLSKQRAGAIPNDRDIEVLKQLLQNHSERERGHEHPYELVLKGITNSTVLLKGGKVISAKPKNS